MKLNKTISALFSVALVIAGLQAGTVDTYAQNKILGNIKSKITKSDEKKAEPGQQSQTKSWFDEPASQPAAAKQEAVKPAADAEAEAKAAAEKTEAEAKAAAKKVENEAKAAASKTAKSSKAAKAAENNVKRVLMIGNSFTFYNNSWDMLAQIAQSEGHELEIVHAAEPGFAFADHMASDATTQAILQGNYDFAILQDQSQTPAQYALNPKGNASFRNNFITMTNRVFGWSPYATIIVEETWAYVGRKFGGFSSMTEFDNYLQNGARLYAEVIRGKVSYAGQAFAIVRSERPDINLYAEDNIHPSAYGSYLKSCSDYLTLFDGKFSAFTSNCGLDEEVCKYLRTAAKKAFDNNKNQ